VSPLAALLLGALAAPAPAAEITSQTFTFAPNAASTTLQFSVNMPMRLHVEASASNAQQRLSLAVYPAGVGGTNRISRADGSGRVIVDTEVSKQDLSTYGTRWIAAVAVPPGAALVAPTVTGRLMVTDGVATAAPPPVAGGSGPGYVPPPPTTSGASAPPPASSSPVPLPPPSGSTAPRSAGYVPPPPSASSAPPPSSVVPTAAPSGRYRLSLLGATVNRKTIDDDNPVFPPVPRRADDAFFVVDLMEMTPQGTGAPQRRKTPVYGTVASGNSATQVIAGSLAGGAASERIRAGTMTVDGGLKQGDSVPYAQPWQRKAPNTSDRLPMLLWEGTLTEGRNILLVAPTVWEVDDGGWMVGRYRNFSASAADMARLMLGDLPPRPELFKAVSDIARDRGVVVPLPEVLNPQVLVRFSSGAGSNPSARPGGIISTAAGAVNLNSTDRPIGLVYQNGQPVFVPRVLLLNYAAAERLVTPPKTPVPTVPSMFGPTAPMPQGTVLVQYRDDDRLGGEYVLFLQLERVQ
jgi:hypothetical protein